MAKVIDVCLNKRLGGLSSGYVGILAIRTGAWELNCLSLPETEWKILRTGREI